MIRLEETIYVGKGIRAVFDYVSDFTHIREWDPGVLSSRQTNPERTGVGAIFDLTLKYGPFRPEMRYEIADYQPFSRVVLNGEGESFRAIDTIRFTETADGTRIRYRADIHFSGRGRWFESVLSLVLMYMGRRAIQGLAERLGSPGTGDSGKSWFRSGASLPDYLADHAIVPGMLMFTRYGYRLGRRFWKEPKGTLYGKTVVLTGGTSGIGKAAAFRLAEKKAFLTIVARNREKATAVCRDIVAQTGNPHVDFMIADLGLMRDVRRVAVQLEQTKKCIDVLINNAGALFNDRQETSEGIERTFATDLLGVFYLTMGLKEALARSKQARIINVSSGGMYTQKIDVDDLENRTAPYNGAKAYARAKRGIVILTRIWAGRFRARGIRVHAMHPGWVDTPGVERSLPEFHRVVNQRLRTPEQGADTIVWLAVSEAGGRSSGRFWLDRRPRETSVFPGTTESAAERQKLWDELTRMTSAYG